jgi:hypothetical protein
VCATIELTSWTGRPCATCVLTSAYVASSSRMRSISAIPETGIMRCMTSSCLKRSASMRAAHNASTSGATRMITEDAEVSGERRWVARIVLYACA